MMSSITQTPRVSARPSSTREVLDEHHRSGRSFIAAGVRSFVREEGTVCMHGMWGSSFLYEGDPPARPTGPSRHGIDLPGFGFAQRPKDYDYSWNGLGRFAVAALEALELDRFHLIVHDRAPRVARRAALAKFALITLGEGYVLVGAVDAGVARARG